MQEELENIISKVKKKKKLEGLNRQHKLSGRQNNGNHPIRPAKRKTKEKSQNSLRDL